MKKKWLLLIPIVAVTLCGCSFLKRLIFGEEDSQPAPIHYNYPDPVVQPDVPGRSIVESFSYNLREVGATTGYYPLNSTGDAKLLVVPVQLRNSSYTWSGYMRNEIEKCFFGQTSDVGWESVSSYYKKSSYGKLNIIGEVAPTFTSNYTYSEINAFEQPDEKIVEEFEQSSTYNALKYSYDTDSNGLIDSVAFIYAEPINVSSTDMRWWAFVNIKNFVAQADKPPVVNHYMWASYYFSQTRTVSNPHGGKYYLDAHTYIHESGHLLGLDDYYSYVDNNAYDPSGGQEMHSQNIGDENIYSKLALGWIKPYYVKTTSSVTTTLYASSYYGEYNAIIINDNWDMRSPMAEYLVLEFYSPTVLNQKDSESEYAKNARMFQTSGFRLYHVDSRLVAYSNTNTFVSRLNDIDPNYRNYIGASNSPSEKRSRLPSAYEITNYKLLHMIQAGGVNTFKNSAKASDADLFKAGQSFVASSAFFANGTKFNAGNEVGYRISIDSIDEANMNGTVTITKI